MRFAECSDPKQLSQNVGASLKVNTECHLFVSWKPFRSFRNLKLLDVCVNLVYLFSHSPSVGKDQVFLTCCPLVRQILFIKNQEVNYLNHQFKKPEQTDLNVVLFYGIERIESNS